VTYTVTFWGTRGSIPTPGAHTARYGGNTSCVAVQGRQDQLVVLDAGSGIRPLGHELSRRQNGAMGVDILLSHTHWDHIQGLPFFQPLNTAGNTVRIFGSAQAGVPLEEILDRQMDPVVFPVPLKALAADLTVTEIRGGRFEIDGFGVEAFRLRHPGTTLGFRLTPLAGGRKQLPNSIVRARPKRGIRAGCPLGLLSGETNCLQTVASGSLVSRPPARWAGRPSCGDSRLRPASGGDPRPIRVRDLCGMREKPAVERRRKMPICRYFSGSDGTRTRDLRRDRPVMALTG